jgi:predicted small lipoprotein YifL
MDVGCTGYALQNFMRGRIMRLSLVVTTLILLGFLSACGQKGDLYLPDKVTKQSADAVQVIYESVAACRT